MRELSEVAPGVLVTTAELYATTSTVITGPDGSCLVVDPAVTVADVAGLAAALAARGLRPAAGWSTHPHWDHVLWAAGLGDVPRYATPRAAEAAERERADLIEGVSAEAPGHDLDLFGRLTPLAAGEVPWDGQVVQIVAHDAHETGHGALFLPATGTLLAGDMLSDLEIPLIDTGGTDAVGAYRAGLELLAGLDVRVLVPGHGHVGDGAEFRRRADADQRYLDGLQRGAPSAGQDERITSEWLRAEHERQVGLLHR
jgi:glyoxylase-like metal-dependent hydrolase (beta-lactamase superfamily II)